MVVIVVVGFIIILIVLCVVCTYVVISFFFCKHLHKTYTNASKEQKKKNYFRNYLISGTHTHSTHLVYNGRRILKNKHTHTHTYTIKCKLQ